MIQPRKATTYGKPSRKPIPEWSAFTEASGPRAENIHEANIISRVLTTRDAGERFLQRSPSPNNISRVKKASKSKMRSHSATRKKDDQTRVKLYDFPSSEEDHERDSFGSEIGRRKKRRITPMNDIPSAFSGFYENKLQRHNATGIRGQLKKTASVTDKAVEKPEVATAHAYEDPNVSKGSEILSVESGAPTSTKAGTLRATFSSNTIKPQSASTRHALQSRFREKQDILLKTPSPERLPIQESRPKQRMSSTMPLKYDSLKRPPAPGRNENEPLEKEEEDLLPSTPPRPTNAADMTTTPKQQELWHKLLCNDVSSTSPQRLNPPGSNNTSRTEQAQSGMIKSFRPQTRRRSASTKLGKRSSKLIDFLMSSAQGSSVSESDCSEDCGSSGEERSKSIQSDLSTRDGIFTTQTSPSIENQSKKQQPQDSALAPVHQSVPPFKGKAKVTYIRERTHLGDDDLNDATMLNVPLLPDPGNLRNRQWRATGELQREHESTSNVCEGLDEVEDSQGGPMRNIHELREAGGNSRIGGELEAILDDLEEHIGSSKTTRRSSLLSLASKLLEASTCRMFIDQSLEPRLLAQLNFSHDIIERSLLAASLFQILFNTTSAIFLSQINHVKMANLLIGLLDQTQDLPRQVKLRENNMSKLAQTEYITFCAAFIRSPVWRTLKPPILSGQILALQCLDLLVHQSREAPCWVECLSFDALSRIAETSLPPLGTIHSQSPYSRICLELAISILEISTRGGAASSADAEWTGTALERIAGVFPHLNENSGLENDNLQSLTLRLYLNLTNTSPHLCETFSNPQIINAVCRTLFLQFDILSRPEYQRQDLHVPEKLVLSLGYLINLAEFSNKMRQMMMDLQVKEQNLLTILLQLFSKRKKAAEAYSEAEAEQNVAFGYLSVLLSYLCLNKAVRFYIDGRQEGPSVITLLDAVEEFLQYHKQLDDSTQQGKGGLEGKANFIGRLEILSDELKLSTRTDLSSVEMQS